MGLVVKRSRDQPGTIGRAERAVRNAILELSHGGAAVRVDPTWLR